MASGFGYSGGRTRCFPFWQEFSKCYAKADDPQECVLPKEDYLECLHRTKEIARAKQIKTTYLQTQAHGQTDARKRAEIASRGVIVSLGLMGDDAGAESGSSASGKEGGAAGKQGPKPGEGAGETGQGSR